jgi:hypothetical protein
MIVRNTGSDLILITQPEHAGLSGRLMEQWQANGFPSRSTRTATLYATTHHDDGWLEEDAAPRVDPDSGRPFDFINMPVSHRQDVWRRAVPRLAKTSTYVAALVAQHALTIYRRYRFDPEWRAFLGQMEHERDRWYTSLPRDKGPDRGLDPPSGVRLSFLQDYTVVRMGDLLSLAFCNGWTTPEELDGFSIWLEDDALKVSPDPFAGRTMSFEIRGRCISARHYESDDDLRRAIEQGTDRFLTGRLVGADTVPAS